MAFSSLAASCRRCAENPLIPAVQISGTTSLIAGSDDFQKYKPQFAAAAERLIAEGRCRAAEFREMGGWVKSTSHGDQPEYFTYCGGSTVAARLYLTAETGEVFN